MLKIRRSWDPYTGKTISLYWGGPQGSHSIPTTRKGAERGCHAVNGGSLQHTKQLRLMQTATREEVSSGREQRDYLMILYLLLMEFHGLFHGFLQLPKLLILLEIRKIHGTHIQRLINNKSSRRRQQGSPAAGCFNNKVTVKPLVKVASY